MNGGIPPLFINLGTKWGWSASHSTHFTPRETAPGTHQLRGWVGTRPGLDALEREKSLAATMNNTVPWLSSPESSHYTEYAIPSPAIEDITQSYHLQNVK